jgi:hypothetical protein
MAAVAAAGLALVQTDGVGRIAMGAAPIETASGPFILIGIRHL